MYVVQRPYVRYDINDIHVSVKTMSVSDGGLCRVARAERRRGVSVIHPCRHSVTRRGQSSVSAAFWRQQTLVDLPYRCVTISIHCRRQFSTS